MGCLVPFFIVRINSQSLFTSVSEYLRENRYPELRSLIIRQNKFVNGEAHKLLSYFLFTF